MFSHLLAAALLVACPLVAECNCSPQKIEALKAKLRAEGASDQKINDVNCEDVCEAEKPLASSVKEEGTAAGSTVACDGQDCTEAKEDDVKVACDGEEKSSTTKEEVVAATIEDKEEGSTSVLAGCNCGGKKTKPSC